MNTLLPILVDLAAAAFCLSVIAAPFVALFVMWRKGVFSKR
jgi:hypothetical protein